MRLPFEARKPPVVAVKTLAAIDSALASDGGALFRSRLRGFMEHADDAYRADEDPHRSHLGASVIGNPCARSLWYGFRWFTTPAVTPRFIRLFNRGHVEEARFLALLSLLGTRLLSHAENGKQFIISAYDGHFGSALDGVILGCPDLPGDWVMCEFKTHSSESFKKLAGDTRGITDNPPGMRESKPGHYAQTQACMHYTGLRNTLYLACNKDTDALYAEIVSYDPTAAQEIEAKAVGIIFAAIAPPRAGKSPESYVCRFCQASGVCFKGDAPNRNCRTCASFAVYQGGQCYCTRLTIGLDKQMQLAGCQDYKVMDHV